MPAKTAATTETLSARDRLLQRAIEYLAERGVSDLSLRELAAGLGTSHRMLIYHFGSRDELVVEVVRAMEARERENLAGLLRSEDSPIDAVRKFWRHISDPALAPYQRLFFEVYGQALQGRPYAVALLDGIVDSWFDPMTTTLGEGEAPTDAARAESPRHCHRARLVARSPGDGGYRGRRRRVRAVPGPVRPAPGLSRAR